MKPPAPKVLKQRVPDLEVYAFIFDEIFLINIPENTLKYSRICANIPLFCKIFPYFF